MARNQSNSSLKFVGAAAAAIVGGVAIGYLVGGARSPRAAEVITPQPEPAISTPAPLVKPQVIRPHVGNGDFTAPGAPRIAIREESTPVMRRVNRTPAVSTDTEATQEAPPPVKPALPTPPAAPATPSTDTGGDTAPPPAPDANGGDTTPAPADNTTPTPAPAAPATDPDFEHVGKPGDAAPGTSNQDSVGKAQFRVQTGAYNDESKARSDADQLRSEGFNTSTRSEREGDHLVYKVQVGAYKSKGGANKAAEDLQKKGYPAYISPVGP